MDQGGLLSFSPDGNKVAYNLIFRNFRTWKRYTGGLAQDITIYDLKNKRREARFHTPNGPTRFPCGTATRFTSPRDRGPEHHLNLYSYDLGSKQVEQLTQFNDFDVMWPSLGPDSIVFENGGYLYIFDLRVKAAKKLSHLCSRRARSGHEALGECKQEHHGFRSFSRWKASGISPRAAMYSRFPQKRAVFAT